MRWWEHGFTGWMNGECADEEMDAGRSGLPSKIDGGSRTILEQEKQHDESGRDKTGRTGRIDSDPGVRQQPARLDLPRCDRTIRTTSITFDRSILSDMLSALRNFLRKPPALYSILFNPDSASLAPLVDPYLRTGPPFPRQKVREGMRTGRRVRMGF
jgi:hypothetical protein